MDRPGQNIRYKLHVKVIKGNHGININEGHYKNQSSAQIHGWVDTSTFSNQIDYAHYLKQFLVLAPSYISIRDLQNIISKQYKTMYSDDQIFIETLKDKHFSDLYEDFLVGDIFDPVDTVYAMAKLKKKEEKEETTYYSPSKSGETDSEYFGRKRKNEEENVNEHEHEHDSEMGFPSPQPQRFSKALVGNLESSAKFNNVVLTAPPSGKSSNLGSNPVIPVKTTTVIYHHHHSSNTELMGKKEGEGNSSKIPRLNEKPENVTTKAPLSSSNKNKPTVPFTQEINAKTTKDLIHQKSPKISANVKETNDDIASDAFVNSLSLSTIPTTDSNKPVMQTGKAFYEDSSSSTEEETQIIGNKSLSIPSDAIRKATGSNSDDEDEAISIVKNKALTNISEKILSRPPSVRPSPVTTSIPLNTAQKSSNQNKAKGGGNRRNVKARNQNQQQHTQQHQNQNHSPHQNQNQQHSQQHSQNQNQQHSQQHSQNHNTANNNPTPSNQLK